MMNNHLDNSKNMKKIKFSQKNFARTVLKNGWWQSENAPGEERAGVKSIRDAYGEKKLDNIRRFFHTGATSEYMRDKSPFERNMAAEKAAKREALHVERINDLCRLGKLINKKSTAANKYEEARDRINNAAGPNPTPYKGAQKNFSLKKKLAEAALGGALVTGAGPWVANNTPESYINWEKENLPETMANYGEANRKVYKKLGEVRDKAANKAWEFISNKDSQKNFSETSSNKEEAKYKFYC